MRQFSKSPGRFLRGFCADLVFYACVALALALLPGGRDGDPASYLVGAVGAVIVAAGWRKYIALRSQEPERPFLGSRRADHLFLALLFLPVTVFMLASPAIPDGRSGARAIYVLAGLIVLTWVIVCPFLVVSARRQMKQRQHAGEG